MSYSTEQFYQLLQNNNFEELLKLEKQYRKEISEDISVKNIFDNFLIDSLINYIPTINNQLDQYNFCKIFI